MKYKIIRFEELIPYIESDEFVKSDIIPITPARAYSQVKNPRANPKDVALVMALNDQDEIVAYAGALPDYLYANPEKKVAWSSGWWVHTQKGRNASLPVLLKLLECYDNKMLFSHLTPVTKSILEKMNLAHVKTIIGIKAILRFNIADQLGARFQLLKNFRRVTKIVDFLFNLFLFPQEVYWKKRVKYTKNHYQEIKSIDKEIDAFIQSKNNTNIVGRAAEEINWITENAWLIEPFKADTLYTRYHFSAVSSDFHTHLFKILQADKVSGFLFLQIREGVMKIPYLYYQGDTFHILLDIIYNECFKNSVNSLVVYHEPIVNYLMSRKTPFIYKWRTKRFIGSTKSLNLPAMNIQDGDGDYAFT